MTQTALSIRMDAGLKREFSAFCENVGMSMSTAIAIFAKAVVRDRRFPFAITERAATRREDDRRDVAEQARLAVERMRECVRQADAPEPTLDEINAFIADVRAQRRGRSRQTKGVHA